MALIAAYLNAGHTGGDSVAIGIYSLSSPTSIPPYPLKKVVICGHCPVTFSITSYRNIKMVLIAAHLNAGIVLVTTP